MLVSGTVKKTHKSMAEIEIARSTACGESCAACRMCSGRNTTVIADNAAGAAEGDSVFISTSDKKVLGAAFMVYIIPVIILIIGYTAGKAVFKTEPCAIGSGFALMAAAFAVIAGIDRRLKQRYTPTVVKIIGK